MGAVCGTALAAEAQEHTVPLGEGGGGAKGSFIKEESGWSRRKKLQKRWGVPELQEVELPEDMGRQLTAVTSPPVSGPQEQPSHSYQSPSPRSCPRIQASPRFPKECVQGQGLPGPCFGGGVGEGDEQEGYQVTSRRKTYLLGQSPKL